MRVVVTGGAGFIGRSVCKELDKQGHEPIVFDRSTGHDLMDSGRRLPRADHVIHLAGVLGTDELFDAVDTAVNVNIKGTVRVLQDCAHMGAGYTGILMPPVFPSVYTATKLCAEHLAKAWHHAYGVPVSHVRAFNAFGCGQKHGPGHPRKIIPAFATEAWCGDPLLVWGDGRQTVDLVHVDDLARMLVDAMAWGACDVFDGGTGQAFTVNDVADMVLGITGSNSRVEHRPMRRGETPTNIVATGEGWDKLGWQPQFRTGDLIEAVQWYQ